jgi:hypothetical protein
MSAPKLGKHNALEVLAERVEAIRLAIAHERELRVEADRRYEDRFRGAEGAVAAALAAQKELTSAAFASSEKAIVKAEDAQREYNVRSNEFRGQLDDQAKTLMPRIETENRFGTMDAKVEEIKKELASLRESRSSGWGKDQAEADAHATSKWIVGLVIVVVLNLLGTAVAIILFVVRTLGGAP